MSEKAPGADNQQENNFRRNIEVSKLMLKEYDELRTDITWLQDATPEEIQELTNALKDLRSKVQKVGEKYGRKS